MKKFTPVKELKIGDVVRVVPSKDYTYSSWDSDFDHLYGKELVIESRALGTKLGWHARDHIEDELWYCNDTEWPVIRVQAADSSENKEKENSYNDSLQKIPDIEMNLHHRISMMSDSQIEKAVQDAKDIARSWVLRNYSSWPHGLKLDHEVDENNPQILKTKWKEEE